MPNQNLDNAILDLTQSIGLLVRRVRAAAASDELSLSESMVTAHLAKNGPATTADLARAEAVKPQSMGTTVAALEKRGIVERKPHPIDGRQMHIALTAKGAELRKSVKGAKLAWLKQVIAQLDEEEQATLFAAGEIIKRLTQS